MFDDLFNIIRASGFTHTSPVRNSQIACDASVRSSCEQNACGKYAKSFSCPPKVGDIDDCIARVRSFKRGYVLQFVFCIEDQYDFDGMMAGQEIFKQKLLELKNRLSPYDQKDYLLLGAGPCNACKTCEAAFGKDKCPFPDKMISSIEAHGVVAYKTLQNVGLKYNNGENTVSYMGLLLTRD